MINVIITTGLIYAAIYWQYNRLLLKDYLNACHCLIYISVFKWPLFFVCEIGLHLTTKNKGSALVCLVSKKRKAPVLKSDGLETVFQKNPKKIL